MNILGEKNVMNSKLDMAIALASQAHLGQKDKGGSVYILHPLRVMMQMEYEDAKIVAVLHDVVEDSAFTFDDLKNEGFSDDILDALRCLTKKQGETYENFIERVLTNRLATDVKIADIKDNMDVTRLKTMIEKDLERIKWLTSSVLPIRLLPYTATKDELSLRYCCSRIFNSS